MSFSAKGARSVEAAGSRVKDADPDSDAAFPAPSSGGVRGTKRCDYARIEWTLLHRGDRFLQVREAGGPDEDGRSPEACAAKRVKSTGQGSPPASGRSMRKRSHASATSGSGGRASNRQGAFP